MERIVLIFVCEIEGGGITSTFPLYTGELSILNRGADLVGYNDVVTHPDRIETQGIGVLSQSTQIFHADSRATTGQTKAEFHDQFLYHISFHQDIISTVGWKPTRQRHPYGKTGDVVANLRP